MPLYELFSHAARYHYRAYLLSAATCILIVSTALALLPPFLLAYFTGNFWIKQSIYSEQPRVTYNSEYLLLIGSTTGTNVNPRFFSSSNAALDSAFQSELLVTSDAALMYDTDNDGITDQWRISFNVTFDATYTITSINAWLIFQFELRGRQRIDMETLGLVSLIPPNSLSTSTNPNVTIYGQLAFEQRQPIQSSGNESIYNNSIINYQTLSAPPDLDGILNEYFIRKYYTLFLPDYNTWAPATTTGTNTLTITVVVNVARQSILFIPGFWQEFKWGWIQYVCVLLPFLFVFDRLKEFVFRNQLVRTIVQVPHHRHNA